MLRSVAFSLLVTSACSVHVHITDDAPKHREELNISEPVTQISIDVGAGNIKLIASDAVAASARPASAPQAGAVAANAAPVNIVANIQGGKNKLRQELRDGKLALSVDCAESPCSADVEARVPAAAQLSAKTGSADIEVV